MANTDTVELLRECDSGAKMAVSSIDEVLDKVHGGALRQLLSDCKARHEQLGDQLHRLLLERGSEDKEPNPVAKGMSWMKTNWKMGMDESDATVADLMTDGCNMGVKSLNRYLNQYRAADEAAKRICGELIGLEEDLAVRLRPHL